MPGSVTLVARAAISGSQSPSRYDEGEGDKDELCQGYDQGVVPKRRKRIPSSHSKNCRRLPRTQLNCKRAGTIAPRGWRGVRLALLANARKLRHSIMEVAAHDKTALAGLKETAKDGLRSLFRL